MTLVFDGPAAAFLAAWTIAALLGIFILVVRWQHAPSRALGLAQTNTSLVAVTYSLGYLEADAAMTAFWHLDVAPIFSIARPFLWLYFIVAFPRPRWFAKRRGGLVLLFAPMLAFEAAFLLDPSWMTMDMHWLWVMVGYFAGALMSVVFFHDFLKEPEGPMRNALFLISVGWLPGTSLVGLYHATTKFGLEPVVYASVAVAVIMLYAYLYLAWRFLKHEREHGQFEPWRRALFFGFPLTALAANAASVALFFNAGAYAGDSSNLVVDAIWCAGGVLLITYGILKYQMLGVDLKVKWTIKQSTVAAVFLAVIFLASEGAQLVFSQDAAWLGLVAGAGLVFALAPVQRFAERVSDAAMPEAKSIGEMDADERHALYRDQARFAWSDGALSAKDRQILEVARERLGLSLEETHALEEEAVAAATVGAG